MIGLGVYLYYLNIWRTSDPPIEPSATWFPVACIFIFTMTCTMGYLVVPWVMIGELYPQKVRGIVGGMTTCMAHIFVFLVVKTYPFLAHALYRHGVFIMYGCISFLGEFSIQFSFVRWTKYKRNIPFASSDSHDLLVLLSTWNPRENASRNRRLLFRSYIIAEHKEAEQFVQLWHQFVEQQRARSNRGKG